MEVWKEIENYEMYEVSNLGNFRSKFTRKIGEKYRKINGTINGNGYKTISLINNTKRTSMAAHRIVAQTFLENHEGKRTVNHKNGHKLDNRVENLEWMTHAENNKHAHDTGLIVNKKNYTKEQADEMVNLYLSGHRQTEICKKFNVDPASLYRIMHKRGIKFDSRSPAYKHSFDGRKKIKEYIFNSNLRNTELSKKLKLSKEHIGKIRNEEIWTDINIGTNQCSSVYTTSKYSYNEMIKLKKIVLDNKEKKHQDICDITNLSIKTVSKIKRDLLWSEIPYE